MQGEGPDPEQAGVKVAAHEVQSAVPHVPREGSARGHAGGLSVAGEELELVSELTESGQLEGLVSLQDHKWPGPKSGARQPSGGPGPGHMAGSGEPPEGSRW